MQTNDVYEEFAGPGGWDEGLALLNSSAHIVAGVDISNDACTTATTAGHKRLCADVRSIDLDELGRNIGGHISSPPCQTFSQMGNGRGRASLSALADAAAVVLHGANTDEALERYGLDERSALVLRPLVVARALKPQWIALEQVPHVQALWNVYAVLLRSVGYRVATGQVHAEQFGVPQTRKRAVLLAHATHSVSLPQPTHSAYYWRSPDKRDPWVKPWLSMGDALGPSWTPTFRDQSGTTYDPEWPWKRPATAIAGRGLVQNPGETANRFNSSTKSRNDGVRISVEEAAVLQSFRRDYPFAGSQSSQFQQVGDAIPPLLAAALLRQVI